MNLLINHFGNTLRAIPAVHYRGLFAREVNSSCCINHSSIRAIAVELSPQAVSEIATWMKELGIGPDGPAGLPCMLGLLKRSRLINPRHRETVFALQTRFEKPLKHIAPSLKRDLLGYSQNNLICLSATDSIIEAIRCAVEMNVPVFGIDLDDFSIPDVIPQLIEDPAEEEFSLEKFVELNQGSACRVRDTYTDSRRELAMAARLKTLLARYNDILFTGGLAHWQKILAILEENTIRPADILEPMEIIPMTRVIVHPLLALQAMDSLPVLASGHENNRLHPLIQSQNLPFLNSAKSYQEILDKTIDEWFAVNGIHQPDKSPRRISHSIPDFERILGLYRLVTIRRVVSINAIMEVARAMVPIDFCNLLFKNLMDIRRPWASPVGFPGLPVISESAAWQATPQGTGSNEQYELVYSEDNPDGGKPYIKEISGSFSARLHKKGFDSVPGGISWIWDDQPKARYPNQYTSSWVWPPCEALLFGSACQASGIAASRTDELRPALFEGSIHNGLDIKASMRSIITGERKIYIRKPLAENLLKKSEGKSPDPVVFIFCSQDEIADSYWSLLMAGSNLGNHIRNQSRYDEVVSRHGSMFISSVALCHSEIVPEHLKPHVTDLNIIDATTLFGNPCMHAKQGAQWIEDNDFRCCPALKYTMGGIHSLVDYYEENFQMEIATDNWQIALVQLAIPFAKRRVVVVAPEPIRLPGKLVSGSGRRNISIDHLPLSYFPDNKIIEMRKRLMVTALDCNGFDFAPEIELALGQKSNQYFELLPPYMQQQIKQKD